jgi:hypothetical protein
MPPAKQIRDKTRLTIPVYTVYLYRIHESGIGHTFVKEIQSTEKPSFEKGYWQDLTNKVWAKTIK